jgi:hypothetical protein
VIKLINPSETKPTDTLEVQKYRCIPENEFTSWDYVVRIRPSVAVAEPEQEDGLILRIRNALFPQGEVEVQESIETSPISPDTMRNLGFHNYGGIASMACSLVGEYGEVDQLAIVPASEVEGIFPLSRLSWESHRGKKTHMEVRSATPDEVREIFDEVHAESDRRKLAKEYAFEFHDYRGIPGIGYNGTKSRIWVTDLGDELPADFDLEATLKQLEDEPEDLHKGSYKVERFEKLPDTWTVQYISPRRGFGRFFTGSFGLVRRVDSQVWSRNMSSYIDGVLSEALGRELPKGSVDMDIRDYLSKNPVAISNDSINVSSVCAKRSSRGIGQFVTFAEYRENLV